MGEVNEKLTAKVKAVNRAHDYANNLHIELVKQFTPLVGKKILKKGGSLLEKYQGLVPGLATRSLSVHKSHSRYSLCYSIRAYESRESFSQSHETYICIGEIENEVLTRIVSHSINRTDYTVRDIEEKRAIHKQAKKAASDALSNLVPFDEYDQ